MTDDDRGEEAEKELLALMIHIIREHEGKLTSKELFFAMQEDEGFNTKLFWRFNHNRLNQLLKAYYIKKPNTNSIKTIYEELSA